jgi:saccharopine dehydrogenase-like NADP-dependent oxidoreductase
MKIIVLGAGLVGGPMALDLTRNVEFEVTLADIDQERLDNMKDKILKINFPGAPKFTVLCCDLGDPAEVSRIVSSYDFVVNAVPGFMGFRTLKAIIEAGKNVVDIAFFIEDPFELHELALKNNVTAIMDMGVAPGMCNVLIGYAHHNLDHTDEVLYMVGGLPEIREWPYEYKAVFSPVDVIEEYTRPARYLENGNFVVKPALSDPELINFPAIGTLEAFNTDGLRSLVKTIRCPNMKEKTLRYPGHIEKMRVLRETGFFSQEEIEIRGMKVKPMDLTARLLFPKWKLEEGQVDITIMKVVVKGRKNGRNLEFSWNLFDKYDPVTGVHSMARTTGYAATAALRMVASGIYPKKGISVPEYIGEYPECVAFILDDLKGKNIIYHNTTKD